MGTEGLAEVREKKHGGELWGLARGGIGFSMRFEGLVKRIHLPGLDAGYER